MIQRYSCIPRSLTRRGFGATVGAALFGTLAQRVARASDPAFTIVIVPDPQYLANTGPCSSTATAYNGLIQWPITNKNLVVNGTPLNIKGIVTVGDCNDHALLSSTLEPGDTIMCDAYDLAYAANIFVVHCPGNHDYVNGATSGDRNNIGFVWKSGRWSPTNIAAKYGAGIDLGSDDYALFGGVYTDPTFAQSMANNYIRVKIGARKMLIVATEFFPRASVLSWVQSLHDTYTDHEVWVTTHSYLTAANNLVTRGTSSNATNQYGPDAYAMCGSYPSSTTGTEQWTVLKTLARNSITTCGHWVDSYDTGSGNWIWQKTSTNNDAGRSVHQVFCNCQTRDLNAPNGCTGSTSDLAHLMLLRIWPTTCEAFLVSTTSNTWSGASGVTGQSAPVPLFSVPFLPVGSGGQGLWALPSPTRRR